ncbi:dihydrofolate reductase family protein [Serratia rubidaea]|uniref:dihydrofolate reductase family protein n=1 Tax=Serratia rubidaea TaxID=61652 RepID=UPI0022B91861|nr:dihydrofolate reductase family protein [Serratia rubidaea]WBF45728.1 dihydrofolate reductase family protein [Serratia rubidaea]
MSKLVYYVAATMDGYIATPQHTLEWLESFTLGSDATPYEEFYQTIGAVIMGADTYHWIMTNSQNDWPYKDVPAFVVTHHDFPIPAGLNISLQHGDARTIAKRAMHAAGGKDVWLVGGGKTAAYFAEAGELHQLFITTIPVFLGAGVDVLPVTRDVKVIPKVNRLLQSGASECISEVQLA